MPEKFVAHTPRKGSEDWHYLDDHLRCVAEKARAFAEKFGAGTLGYWAGLLHDIGKYNPEFQRYLEQAQQGKKLEGPPHAVHGAAHALDKGLATLMLTIYAHHVGLKDPSFTQDKAQPVAEDAAFSDILEQANKFLPLDKLEQAVQAEQVIGERGLDIEFFVRMLFSALVDADFLDTEKHFDPDKEALRTGQYLELKTLWQTFQTDQAALHESSQASPSPVNEVRRDVYDLCVNAAESNAGVFRLAVPTGGGKTRSGLAFALRHAQACGHERIIVAVPYTSIIEQTVDVYRSIFGYEAVLEHHSAVKESSTYQDEDVSEAAARSRLLSQNWDAPLIVTTTVQLFESLFANRTSRCRKLHNLTNSIIILDEVQTLPLDLLEPTLAALRELVEHYGVTVLLCTATQPAFESDSKYLEGFARNSVKDIIPPETAKNHFELLRRVDYEIRTDPTEWQTLALELSSLDQVLVILNTRKDALELLAHLESDSNPEENNTFHLSTLLCGQHRRDVLSEVKTRLTAGKPCTLVSTQVVEAGVDLDFPKVYRALGPLDRIVQAAGRCNREGRLENGGQVVVFEPEGGGLPRGNYATAFSESKRFLSDDIDLHDPNVFERYFSSLYQLVDTDQFKVQALRRELNYPKVAEAYRLIREDTVPVVVTYGDAHKELRRIRYFGNLLSSDYRALQPYVVSLRRREFDEHKAAGLVEELLADSDVWVWKGKYDMVRGLSSEWDAADLVF